MTRFTGYRTYACPRCGCQHLFPTWGSINLSLPAPRGADYVWQIVSADPRALRQFKNVTNNDVTSGLGGTATISFIAQRPSRSTVRFAYVPASGGKETESIDGYEVVLTIER